MNITATTSDLWHKDGAVRLRAVENLFKAVSEMEDIRCAQPALTLLLCDPNPHVKRAALLTIEYRARLGADIGLAVPMLETLLSDDDEEIRETAWQAIQYADRRLFGIAEIVELRKPEFMFSRTTRTTLHPKGVPDGASDGVGSIEKWSKEPYATPEGRQFFATLLSECNLDAHTEAALSRTEDINSIRAAAYLLEVLGFPEIWPGNPKLLQNLTERAAFLLKAMVDSKSGTGSKPATNGTLFGDILVSVERQIGILSSRFRQ
jgi:HEAT repeat protein